MMQEHAAKAQEKIFAELEKMAKRLEAGEKDPSKIAAHVSGLDGDDLKAELGAISEKIDAMSEKVDELSADQKARHEESMAVTQKSLAVTEQYVFTVVLILFCIFVSSRDKRSGQQRRIEGATNFIRLKLLLL